MTQKDRPIGFFDSGVGGISVLKQALKVLDGENYIYLGDNLHVPYGNKTEDEIRRLSMQCGDFLYQKGVKAIVVACNTATSIAVQTMREKYCIPVVSIEPAVKPAIEADRCGKILVMATPATISQRRYNALLDRVGQKERVINLPCEGLAQDIEQYALDGPEITDYLEEKFAPFAKMTVAGIVLGCTHYSFIEKTIRRVAGRILPSEFEIYDGRYGTVRQLKRVLAERGLLREKRESSVEFYATGDQQENETFQKFLLLEE